MIRSWRVVCVVRWVWRLVTAVAMVGLALYGLVSVLHPASVAVEMGASGQPRVLRLHSAAVVADLGSLVGYQVAPVRGGYDVTFYLRR